jgi:type VI secretion system protein ImpH
MAGPRWRKAGDLEGELCREAYRFDFFQAVRMLERIAFEQDPQAARRQSVHVGHDSPEQEAVRFRSQPSLSFPPNPILHITPLSELDPAQKPIAELVVTFMGVTGPIGVLPYHYTALLLRRIRDKDYSLRDFLDIFHHRAIALFYRAWTKYRLPFAYEHYRTGPANKQDQITWALYCLIGLGTQGLRRRLGVDDEALVYFAGHFAHYPRSAAALETMLADYFELPIQVIQMEGQWLELPPSEQAVMPNPSVPRGMNHQLGVSLVVGDRVWDVQSKFRIKVGPLTYAEFQQFLPSGDALRRLSHLTRTYVGPEFDFDVQLILRADEVPASHVGRKQNRLGWDSWMQTRKFSRDADEAVFTLDEIS